MLTLLRLDNPTGAESVTGPPRRCKMWRSGPDEDRTVSDGAAKTPAEVAKLSLQTLVESKVPLVAVDNPHARKCGSFAVHYERSARPRIPALSTGSSFARLLVLETAYAYSREKVALATRERNLVFNINDFCRDTSCSR